MGYMVRSRAMGSVFLVWVGVRTLLGDVCFNGRGNNGIEFEALRSYIFGGENY